MKNMFGNSMQVKAIRSGEKNCKMARISDSQKTKNEYKNRVHIASDRTEKLARELGVPYIPKDESYGQMLRIANRNYRELHGALFKRRNPKKMMQPKPIENEEEREM